MVLITNSLFNNYHIINMMGWFSWLSMLLFFLCVNPSHPLCHPSESSALLSFKNSFSVTNERCGDSNSTISWGMSEDCCSWSGVSCDEANGHVISLYLHCSGLRGVIDSNNSLFSLTRLQTLLLSRNDFEGSEISPNFGSLSGLIHLDLDRKSTRLNSSHSGESRMPSSA